MAERIKSNGVHYTPPQLAGFLAAATFRSFEDRAGAIRVLDPACGDGELLAALYGAVPENQRQRLVLCGYETDPAAIRRAEHRLSGLDGPTVELREGDFLELTASARTQPGASGQLFGETPKVERIDQADIVIANPPYVRTQVLGADRAQQLALAFGLTGRVDLYHAFVAAVSTVMRPGGVLGLLTSNRFMVVQSGVTTRSLLRRAFDLKEVYDLGDTKLFTAAVLPAILVGVRSDAPARKQDCRFVRVYEDRGAPKSSGAAFHESVLDAVQMGTSGSVRTPLGTFGIERGHLAHATTHEAPWALASEGGDRWLSKVYARRRRVFGDLGNVRVGIKTTADSVFIRDDWHSLSEDMKPESELLRPLITHHAKARWWIGDVSTIKRRVLYPHRQADDERKQAVDLDAYPQAKRYLEAHREKLESRRYVIESGRQWYEIWVPQQPLDWPHPKVVFPDIAEHPRFFLDTTGAIVNGDCYWLKLRPGLEADWLLLVLAVANSTFITRYYDTRFHNKLYAGRRRFITQYVREFPLPDIDGTPAQRIIEQVRRLVNGSVRDETAEIERIVDSMVWESFGVAEEPAR
ncbi:MAG: Eco57I restriction-modification methylase domain-containing protein [Phycisphaerales bacterium]